MFQVLLITLRLQISYTMNSLQYYLRRIPLIKRLFWNMSYEAPNLKIVFSIFAGIWYVIKKFAIKILYFLLVVLVSQKSVFMFQTLVFLTLAGGFFLNRLFQTNESDYYAVCLLRMDARKYALSRYFFDQLCSFVFGFAGLLLVMCLLNDMPVLDGLLLALFGPAVKFAFSPVKLFQGQRHVKSVTGFETVFLIVCLAAALILPFFEIEVPTLGLRIIAIASIPLAGLGLYKILTFKDYSSVYRREIAAARTAIENNRSQNNVNVKTSRESLSDSMKATSHKKGFAYMHELFIKRHVKILWRPSLITSAVILVVLIVTVLVFLIVPDIYEGLSVLGLLPVSVFLMYLINRGLPFTQALYVNCDHSMLTYSFYKTPGSILKLFILRLASIIKINLLPAFILGLGLDVLECIISDSFSLIDLSVIFVSIIALSIFFSVHYLTIYYLLQPYNAATEIKSPAYSIVKGGTYVVCYFIMQTKISSVYFGIGTIAFCLLYCIISCILVYRLAPKTFRIRN